MIYEIGFGIAPPTIFDSFDVGALVLIERTELWDNAGHVQSVSESPRETVVDEPFWLVSHYASGMGYHMPAPMAFVLWIHPYLHRSCCWFSSACFHEIPSR